jgi:hypothetical protein
MVGAIIMEITAGIGGGENTVITGGLTITMVGAIGTDMAKLTWEDLHSDLGDYRDGYAEGFRAPKRNDGRPITKAYLRGYAHGCAARMREIRSNAEKLGE